MLKKICVCNIILKNLAPINGFADILASIIPAFAKVNLTIFSTIKSISCMLSTLIEVEGFIEQLKQIDRETNEVAYKIIKDLIFSLRIPLPILTIYPNDIKLARCRIHKKEEEGIFFEKIDDISYRKDLRKILEFERCNEPYQSIFYASYGNDDKRKRQTSFSETSDIIRDKIDREYQIVTFGAWEIIQPLNATFILGRKEVIALNKIIEKITCQFHTFVQQYGNSNTQPHVRFLEFLSEKFKQNELKGSSKYKISCAFSNNIFSKKGRRIGGNMEEDIDVIIYSSAIDPEGVNFAIHPRAIESGKLKLISACKSTMRRVSERNYKEEKFCEYMAIDYDKGIIKWV